MRRVLILTTLMLIMASALMAQAPSINLQAIGIKKSNGSGNVAEGDIVEVKYKYSAANLDEGSEFIVGSAINASNVNKLDVIWYSDLAGTTRLFPNGRITVEFFNDYHNYEDGVDNYNTLTFALPLPHASAKTFRVSSRIYSIDGYDPLTFSNTQTSSDVINGYFGYLTLDTNKPPVASNVRIKNPAFAKVGQILEGEYSYSDPDPDPESGTTFRWLRADTENGTYSAISGATNLTYTVVASDIGKYLRFEVTPRASAGVTQGIPVRSAAAQASPKPSISMNAKNGNVLLDMMTEANSNDGLINQAQYIHVFFSNTKFNTDYLDDEDAGDIILVSDKPIANLHVKKSDISIESLDLTEIKFPISGKAFFHENLASIFTPDCVKVIMPPESMIGVSNGLEPAVGVQISFNNNPPGDPSRDEISYNSVKIKWDTPVGLLDEGSGLSHFIVLRDNQNIGTAPYRPGKAVHSYIDNSVVAGISHSYEIEAVYDLGGGNKKTLNSVSATPMGFNTFRFAALNVDGIIDHAEKTVTLSVPAGTTLNGLVASFTAPDAPTISVNGSPQVSGSTPNNFNSPVEYKIVAHDGSTVYYTVNVKAVLATPIFIDTIEKSTASSINVEWNPVPCATSYTLGLSTDEDFSSFVDGYTEKEIIGTTLVIISNLSAGTTYYFRVKANSNDTELSSQYNTDNVNTKALESGKGSTEINGTGLFTINVGPVEYEVNGETKIFTPEFSINVENFNQNSPNKLVHFMASYGNSKAPKWNFKIDFDQGAIKKANFAMGYSGLDGASDITVYGATAYNDEENQAIVIPWETLPDGDGPISLDGDFKDQTLPVVLSSFTAQAMAQGRVRLNWTTQSESGVLGYQVLRGTNADMAESITISPLIEATNTSNLAHYSYLDKEIPGNGLYYYWLQSNDLDGSIQHFGPIPVELTTGEDTNNQVPLITSLNSPYPNPFNPRVIIPFDLAEKGLVRIAIYNTKGQLVKTLVDKVEMPKSYNLSWDGRDDAGKKVASGSYIIRMDAGKYHASKKVVLLK